jgi:hypothetical protein
VTYQYINKVFEKNCWYYIYVSYYRGEETGISKLIYSPAEMTPVPGKPGWYS